jgi:uncharacterized protein
MQRPSAGLALVARVISACVLLVCTLAAGQPPGVDVPAHVGKVNDFAELLDASQRQTLEDQLGDLEREISAEVALATMRTLNGRSIEDYATTLFNTWGIGKQDRDNGVLVLVVVQDRAMRIEVGYGLEGILPDGLAGAVIRDTFLPRFRADDYANGVIEGMARLIEIVRRNETVTLEQRIALDRAAADAARSWDLVWLGALFVTAGAFTLGTAAGAKVVVQLVFGLFFTSGVLGVGRILLPQAAVWVLVALALGVAVLGFVLARRPKWRRRIRGSDDGGSSTRWIANSTSDSSSGSSGGSGGSDSFGGGSSGGGGATGRW